MASTTAVIVAAGRGLRAGGGVPKQWRDLNGQSIVDRSVAAFASHPGIDAIVLVLNPEELDRWTAPGVTIVAGGATRQDSVIAGLAVVKTDHVLIHDAARPLVTAAVIDRVCAALDNAPGYFAHRRRRDFTPKRSARPTPPTPCPPPMTSP